MKKFKRILLFLGLSISITALNGQEIKGEIISNDNNITIVRVWGTHEDRGYATGYLLAEKIIDLYENFIVPSFGGYLAYAKLIMNNPANFTILEEYKNEAISMIEGIKDAGYEIDADYIDILLANSFLDIANMGMLNLNLRNGCSSLISWGDATNDSELEGKSIITRHMDWNDMDVIIRNQVMVIHIPEEEDEQPWLLIGFAGQISVLSGLNQSGLAVMQHMLADEYSNGSLNKAYEPIWFTLRKIIEKKDFNGDGENNAKDILDGITENTNGYGDGYIVAGMAPAVFANDSLVSIIAEMAPTFPYISIRHNTYEEDAIPGKNLYAANFSISRNDAQHFCMRYDSIIDNIGEGTAIGADESWDLMLNHSSTCAFGGPGNIQFMQYIPEDNYLKLAVHLNDGTQACENEGMIFDTEELFTRTEPVTIGNLFNENDLYKIYPNPSISNVYVKFNNNLIGEKSLKIFSMQGVSIINKATQSTKVVIENLKSGIYILVVYNDKIEIGREVIIIN
jgi:hypothetical protein